MQRQLINEKKVGKRTSKYLSLTHPINYRNNVFFSFADNHQQESATALAELENIDTQADKVGIAFVKINDLELVSEFGLGTLPSLIYYRHTTPIVYDGE
jgi:UDP-N-acetylglucosamine transferase subunit ALG13